MTMARTIFIEKDGDNHVLAVSTFFTEKTPVTAHCDGFLDVNRLEGYLCNEIADNGEYVLTFHQDLYDQTQAVKEQEANRTAAEEFQKKMIEEKILDMATDEEAMNMQFMYPEWRGDGVNYAKDKRLRYNGKFYKVLQAHTSQEDWTPDTASGLLVCISDPAIEWPEYVQPNGANPYMTGNKVIYKGKKYVCKMDNTVWNPEEYPAAWDEYVEEEPTKTTEE